MEYNGETVCAKLVNLALVLDGSGECPPDTADTFWLMADPTLCEKFRILGVPTAGDVDCPDSPREVEVVDGQCITKRGEGEPEEGDDEPEEVEEGDE